MRWTGRSIIFVVAMLLFSSSNVFGMVPEQLEKTCTRHINQVIENCRALSDLCCDSKLENVRAEGNQKRAMAEFYEANKSSLLSQMLVQGVDCHKDYEVKAFLIKRYFAFAGK